MNTSNTPRQRRLKLLGRRIFHSAIVGVLCGLVSIAFYWLLHTSLHLFLGHLAGYAPAEAAGEPLLYTPADAPFRRWMLLFCPALGGLLSGCLVRRFAHEASGPGTGAAIEAFHQRGGRVRARVIGVKTLASAITMGSGGSGGREGPVAHVGAALGSALAHLLKVSDQERRILMVSGLAAGVGSIFRAPLAGALYAGEVMYRSEDIEHEALIPSVVSAIVAYSLFSTCYGLYPLFRTGSYGFYSPVELIPYTLLGLSCAIGGFAFARSLHFARRVFHRLRAPQWLKPMLGGLGAGAVGTFLPATLAIGYGEIQRALDGDIAVGLLLAVAIGKIVSTSCTIGSGGSAGLFAPSMVIGGCIGGAVGKLCSIYLPHMVSHPQAFVLVGMVGMFSGIASTPISTIIMVSEMTGNYYLLAPSMWVCAISYLLLRTAWLYDEQLPDRTSSPAHRGEMAVDVLQGLRVADWMNSDVVCLPASMSLREAMRLEARDNHSRYPVVDEADRVVGLLTAKRIVGYLATHDDSSDLPIETVMSRDVPHIAPTSDLHEALTVIDRQSGNLLVVMEHEPPAPLLGVLTRNDILHAHREMMQRGLPAVRRTATGAVHLPDDIAVAEAMTIDFDAVQPDTSLVDLERLFHKTGHHGFPVVAGEDELVGVVTLADLDRARGMNPTPRTARDIATINPVYCHPHETLTEALRKLGRHKLGRLPVVDARNPHRIVGLLRRGDIVSAYAKAAEAGRLDASAAPEELHQADFIVLDVSEASPIVGLRIADLSLPPECLLVAITRNHLTVIPHGDTILHPGDRVLAMAAEEAAELLRAMVEGKPGDAETPDAATSDSGSR